MNYEASWHDRLKLRHPYFSYFRRSSWVALSTAKIMFMNFSGGESSQIEATQFDMLTQEVRRCFVKVLCPFFNDLIDEDLFETSNCHRIAKETTWFVINTVPADGLAPLGARPSAGTVMTKFGFYI